MEDLTNSGVRWGIWQAATTSTAGGTKLDSISVSATVGAGDIKQPLSIKRQTLIDTLQEHLDEEKAKRHEEESKQAERRKRALDAIREFSYDELANIFRKFVYPSPSVTDFEAWVTKAKENRSFVSPDVKPSPKESDLEKYVRVLGLATNDVIEVTPSDPVYPLL